MTSRKKHPKNSTHAHRSTSLVFLFMRNCQHTHRISILVSLSPQTALGLRGPSRDETELPFLVDEVVVEQLVDLEDRLEDDARRAGQHLQNLLVHHILDVGQRLEDLLALELNLLDVLQCPKEGITQVTLVLGRRKRCSFSQRRFKMSCKVKEREFRIGYTGS